MLRRFGVILLGLLAALILPVAMGSAPGIYLAPRIMRRLLTGWIAFPVMVAPNIRIYWPSILMGLISLGIVIVLTHYFGHWLMANWKPNSSSLPRRRWRGRWTLAVVGLVVIMFVAGIAAVGIVHQYIWFARDAEQARIFQADDYGWVRY